MLIDRLLMCYVLIAMVTFGIIFSAGRAKGEPFWKVLCTSLFCGFIWPFYWYVLFSMWRGR